MASTGMTNQSQSVIAALQAENARLVALLEAHGIDWRLPLPSAVVAREQNRRG